MQKQNLLGNETLLNYKKYLFSHYPSTYRTLEETGSLHVFLKDVDRHLKIEHNLDVDCHNKMLCDRLK